MSVPVLGFEVAVIVAWPAPPRVAVPLLALANESTEVLFELQVTPVFAPLTEKVTDP